MESTGKFLLLFMQQFAGGPGPIENNLMRFGLAGLFWLGLLLVAWSRQRKQPLPREKLLIWGFGLALARELMMFSLIVMQITGGIDSGGEDIYYHPLEHGLEVAALIVVAGAFLRYALDDERISLWYLLTGLSATVMLLLVSYITWPRFSNMNPDIKFSATWESRAFHILSFTLIAVAIFILAKERGWLRSVVRVALSFFFFSELLRLVSYATNNVFHDILCPVSNTFHLFAIPIFGFVYLKEMSIEKNKTEEKLDKYRDHLEELVDERTAMLVAQNALAGSLSKSLDLTTILGLALDKVMPVLSMEVGLAFLVDRKSQELALGAYQGRLSQEDLDLCAVEGCPYKKIGHIAIEEKHVVIKKLEQHPELVSAYTEKENIHILIGAPLISKDRIVGAITLGSEKVAPLDATNLALLAAVCSQIGMAVENAYLYQETEMWANGLRTLHQASIKLGATLDAAQINKEIVDQSIKLTGCEIACVLMWNRKEQRLTCSASSGIDPETVNLLTENPGQGRLFDALADASASIVIEDITQDMRVPPLWEEILGNYSLLGISLWNNGKKSESLFIMNPSKLKPWLSKDIELVESFVSRASVALENAHLHKHLEWAATLEERQRIAANMHDGLAQTISLLGLKVDHMAQLLPADQNDDLLGALDNIHATVQQASVDVRKSIASLQNMPEPRKSLQELLDSLIAEWAQQGDIAFDADFAFPASLVLSPGQNAQLTPILQEVIVNIRKHAKASRVSVYGEQQGKTITIVLEDDGVGFDADVSDLQDKDSNHFGIKIMQARAERLGCTFALASRPNVGTRVTLNCQLDDEAASRPMPEPIYEPIIFMEGESYA